ncbi:MAG: phosphoglucomutase (alpha-D-glucose-1,6-bisphosphate-dependent) [Victivallales bacterium]|nr:phosphoglucomutase (alpha-D-glucose-1,6-bisphosphate-dependent) [Victivallales bacterium]
MMNELAGRTVPESRYLDIPALVSAYYTGKPDPGVAEQRVVFGTSGHRGTPLKLSFQEDHILAITQAICAYRKKAGVSGPLFLGRDTHALSGPAHATALEVLAANGVTVLIAAENAYTPTPVVSHAILNYNAGRRKGLADGIVITPSHNPPTDGGFKYDPTTGGPADTTATKWIADEANRLLEKKLQGVKRLTLAQALASEYVKEYDYLTPYVDDLKNVIDFEVIRSSGIRIGADALGGAGLGFWVPIAQKYGLDLTLMHGRCEPDFRFMAIDHDGKIRMDCSSPYAMAGLVKLKSDYDIAFGNDPDFDRHGIVTPSHGLMNPNHYLAVAIDYLYQNRRKWSRKLAVGKTVVSSSLIDQVAKRLGRKLVEVPVGFKWFVPGLLDGTLGFGGEESAGASFLRKDGTTWTTDKDGIILALLACEITARTGRDPARHHDDLVAEFGPSWYERHDQPGTPEQKVRIAALNPQKLPLKELAGEPVTGAFTEAPGNGASIGGIKVTADHGWFAMRPSGTENVVKIYAESTQSAKHLAQIFADAEALLKG